MKPTARDWQRYLATGNGSVIGKRIEITAQRADGTEFPVELAVCRVQRSDPPVFTAYMRDLTKQKEAEAALAERARLAALTLTWPSLWPRAITRHASCRTAARPSSGISTPRLLGSGRSMRRTCWN